MRNSKLIRHPIFFIAIALGALVLGLRPARADVPVDAVKSLDAWLAKPSGERGKLADQSFASAPLTKDQAVQARKLLWDDHVKLIRAERAKEWKDEAITIGEHTL